MRACVNMSIGKETLSTDCLPTGRKISMCLLSSKRIWKTHTHTYTLSLSQKVLYSLLKLGRNYLSSSGIYHLRNKHSISQLLEKYVCVCTHVCVCAHAYILGTNYFFWVYPVASSHWPEILVPLRKYVPERKSIHINSVWARRKLCVCPVQEQTNTTEQIETSLC